MPPGAARAGWTALLFGVSFMSVAALTFIAIPRVLLGAFTTDPRVIELGVSLLAVAAVFQLFDGLQGVATGVLRGLGDTRTPMFWNLGGHWGIGLPLAYLLAFHFGFGRDRAVVGPVGRPDHLRYRSAGRLVAPDPRGTALAVSPGQQDLMHAAPAPAFRLKQARSCQAGTHAWRHGAADLAPYVCAASGSLRGDAVGVRRIGIIRARTDTSRQDWHRHDPRRRARSRRRRRRSPTSRSGSRTPARRSKTDDAGTLRADRRHARPARRVRVGRRLHPREAAGRRRGRRHRWM